MKIQNSWFSMVEILIGIIITSFIMVAAFSAITSIGIWKTKIIEKTQVEKQAYFASEIFFEMIKKWGSIDYEEYWNRYSYSTWYTDGHFTDDSGFWNYGYLPAAGVYGRKPYFCMSENGTQMGTGWCLEWYKGNYDNSHTSLSHKSKMQRYKQYSYQFIDYNSDADNDLGNEDASTETFINFVWDDDDLHLGIGPDAFPSGIDVWELYLINNEGNERTLFRWNVSLDPNAPTGATCDPVVAGEKAMTWTGCLGSIEFLKLTGEDFWFDHNSGVSDTDGTQDDGIIDTWLIHRDFLTGATDVIAGSGTYDYWQPIFPNSINVSDVEFYLYPHKDIHESWRDSDSSIENAPYLQLKMKLQPSWKQKRKIIGEIPVVDIATTIQLSDLDFR